MEHLPQQAQGLQIFIRSVIHLLGYGGGLWEHHCCGRCHLFCRAGFNFLTNFCTEAYVIQKPHVEHVVRGTGTVPNPYSQEIRMYAFLAMWLLLATYAHQRAIQTKNWKWWMLFSVAPLAQIHIIWLHSILLRWHYYLFSTRLEEFQAITFAAWAPYPVLPWLIQLPSNSPRSAGYWGGAPDISRLLTLLMFTDQYSSPTPGSFRTFYRAHHGNIGACKQRGLHARPINSGIWAFYLAFTPPLLLFYFAWRPVYIERAYYLRRNFASGFRVQQAPTYQGGS